MISIILLAVSISQNYGGREVQNLQSKMSRLWRADGVVLVWKPSDEYLE